MPKKKSSFSQFLPLALAFTLMCMFRLWFTLFILLAYAVTTTLIYRKAKYCVSGCPIGTVTDYCYTPTEKYFSIKPPVKKAISFLYPFLFWIVVGILLILDLSPYRLWHSFLILMVSAGASAVITQALFGKRYFCSTLCPYRSPFIKAALFLRRKRR